MKLHLFTGSSQVGTICCRLEKKDNQNVLYLMTMGVLAVSLKFLHLTYLGLSRDSIPALPLTETRVTKSGTHPDRCRRTCEAQNRQGVPSRSSFQPRREEILRAARLQ
jgi:hypothetical protein